jgi:hypothetical protein
MDHSLFMLLDRLDAAHFHYTLGRYRTDSVLVAVTAVGQRIEIDVFRDGHMEISRFIGREDIEGGVELIDSIVALGR